MKFRAFLLILAVALLKVNLIAGIPGFAKDPAISPDGTQVCFVFDEDLWIVPFAGGVAQRLTNTEAVEYSPFWSPDGKWIAFHSNREGRTFPYLISPKGGEAKVIIRESYSIRDWYHDSKHLLVVRSGFEWGSSFYKLPIDGKRGTLIGEFADAFASLAPDNKSIVFSRYGNAHREAYTGSLNGDLYSYDISNKKYKQLTKTKYSERYPRFSHSSNALYYCYSDGDCFQLYQANKLNFSRAEKLSELKDFSARDISIARVNDRIVFEYFDAIYKYDPLKKGKNKIQKLDISISEDLWQYTAQNIKMKDTLKDYSISENGLLLSYNYLYDTFLVPRKGGEARQLTFDHSGWSDMRFIGNKSLLLAKTDGGVRQLFCAEIDSSLSLQAVKWFGAGKYSVDRIRKDFRGRWQLFYSDYQRGGNVAVADSGFVNLKPIDTPWAVSSDFCINKSGTHAIYSSVRDDNYMRDVYLYDFEQEENRRLFTDESWCANFFWNQDESSIFYSRGQDLYRLDLMPRDEFEYEKDYWQEVFDGISESENSSFKEEEEDGEHLIIFANEDSQQETEEIEADKAPEIEWEGLDKRRHKLYSGSNAYLWVLDTTSDSTFYYIEQPYNRKTNDLLLKKGDIYGKESQLEANLGKDVENLQKHGKTLYYLQNGALKSYGWQNGKREEISIALEYDYDEHELNKRVFEEAWGAFKEYFYDPDMHNVNWEEQYKKYRPFADKARNIDDIGTIVDEMIGDLNASHTGFYPRSSGGIPYKSLAYLGLDLDYSQLLGEGIKIRRVYPGTKLASFYKIKAGDIISHIDGHKITAFTPIDSLLIGKAAKPIVLDIQSKSGNIKAKISGLSYFQARTLWYEYKCEQSRKLVDELSNGKLGYVHIPSMGEVDYDKFVLDVFRDNHEKEALVLDFRGNTGGRIHDKIIQLLIKDAYAYSYSRRFSLNPHPEPLRGIRVPTIVLVDEHSFSDGEIFPIVYQELKLGKVVGYPSSGAVIGTWQYRLLDGSEMRMPGSGWYKLDGTNMEGTGAQPDIVVENSLNDRLVNKDRQLERAVQELLKELK